jgi:hypothetical protein
MSDGHYCVVRDLGPVKGGKGMKHHEVVIDLSPRRLLSSLRRSLGNVAQNLPTTAATASQENAL